MYGFVALFDEQTENLIRQIWKELKTLSISSYAYEVKDRMPHITLANYHELNLKEFTQGLDYYFAETQAIDITFSSIGSFLKSGTLFYSPVITKELVDFHWNFHKHFASYNNDLDSLYLPGKWVPHCTIANYLSPEKLKEAIIYCSQRYHSFQGRITKLALIDVSEKGKAPMIYLKELKE